MSRRPSRRRGRQRDAFPWIWAALGTLLLVAIVGGFGWLYVTASASRVALDTTLCPQTGATGQKLVLVDVSDAIAPITRQDLLNHMHEVAATTAKGERFELRVLDPGASHSRTVFSFCNPGDGSELSELTGNPALALKSWQDGFSVPLEAALSGSVAAGQADSSPIMGAIQELAVERLGSAADRAIPTSIYVASDLLEHTEAFSMYRSGADFAAWKGSAGAVQYATELAGAEVTLWVIKRNAPVPSAAAADFWASWIADNHGRTGRTIAMQGVKI